MFCTLAHQSTNKKSPLTHRQSGHVDRRYAVHCPVGYSVIALPANWVWSEKPNQLSRGIFPAPPTWQSYFNFGASAGLRDSELVCVYPGMGEDLCRIGLTYSTKLVDQMLLTKMEHRYSFAPGFDPRAKKPPKHPRPPKCSVRASSTPPMPVAQAGVLDSVKEEDICEEICHFMKTHNQPGQQPPTTTTARSFSAPPILVSQQGNMEPKHKVNIS